MLLNMIFYYFIAIISFGYLYSAMSLGAPLLNGRPEPSFFPIMIGLLACFFSFVLIFRNIKSRVSYSDEKIKRNRFKDDIKPLLVIISIFIYISSFSFIGYFISSFLFVLSIVVIFSSMDLIIKKSIVSFLIVSLGYLVFEQVFGVRLPAFWE